MATLESLAYISPITTTDLRNIIRPEELKPYLRAASSEQILAVAEGVARIVDMYFWLRGESSSQKTYYSLATNAGLPVRRLIPSCDNMPNEGLVIDDDVWQFAPASLEVPRPTLHATLRPLVPQEYLMCDFASTESTDLYTKQ